MHFLVRLVGRQVAVDLSVHEVGADVGVIRRVIGGVIADIGEAVIAVIVINDIEAVAKHVGRSVRVAAVKVFAYAPYEGWR